MAAHRDNYADPGVAAVSGRVLQPGPAVPEKKHWPALLDYRYFAMDSTRRQENVASLRGCNHSVRRAFARRLGGYDANYIGWAFREDTDMALRIWKAGGRIVFDPRTTVTHLCAPAGGCRTRIQNRPLPEWKVSFPASYFAARHLFPTRWFWYDLLLGNVRRYVFRKENVCRPWRLPWALSSYLYSAARGLWISRLGLGWKGGFGSGLGAGWKGDGK